MSFLQRMLDRLPLSREKQTLGKPPRDVGWAVVSGTESRSNRYAGPKAGTAALCDIFEKQPWLHSITGKIATAVGSTSWKIYVVRNKSTGKIFRDSKIQYANSEIRESLLKKQYTRDQLEEIEEHPLLDLLRMGNIRHSGENVMYLTSIYLDLVGEAFLLLERNMAGAPASLYPIPPHWILEFPSREYPAYRVRLSSLTYDIPQGEILHIQVPQALNPYERGAGIGKALGDEIEISEFTSKFIKNFYWNNAKPSLVISADGLSPENTKRLEENWISKHQGFWNAFKPTFLSRKVEIKEVGQNMSELQLSESRKAERDTMLQVFGVPPEKWGVLSQSNRSTIVAADVFWTKDVLRPRIERLRNSFQRLLVPEFDSNLILDYETPEIHDQEFELEVMRAHPGAFTINEWREAANMPSLGDDGEFHILGSAESYFPTGEPPTLDDLVGNQESEGSSGDSPPQNGDENKNVMKEIELEIQRRALAAVRKRKLH